MSEPKIDAVFLSEPTWVHDPDPLPPHFIRATFPDGSVRDYPPEVSEIPSSDLPPGTRVQIVQPLSR